MSGSADVNFDYFSKQLDLKLRVDLFCLSDMQGFLEDTLEAELRKNTYAGMHIYKYGVTSVEPL